jgi:hypothetical protein
LKGGAEAPEHRLRARHEHVAAALEDRKGGRRRWGGRGRGGDVARRLRGCIGRRVW